ncbi:hypothetical protein LMG28688_01151 [Paraburkholderia caffeinitolerans]|uniref:Uncharacterized protein n=1 Tax=Paraburkholderia caffeinitolerans TaxID=1723730 RepID=A0A6J5FIN4_9BURK|nr:MULTISPECIES: hypothetical protein [Paraburkholderia]CAB3780960.1 hypothetical protein LMG28688_01151 [Paraburkholderia caffeinitolerans]
MLYLKNALGGIGRSVSCTARLAFMQTGGAARWRKFALYAAMFVLPGGSIAVALMVWADRRRAQRDGAGTSMVASGVTPPATSPVAAAMQAAAATTAAAKAACSGVQVACRANTTRGARTRAGRAALHAVHALSRWRRNDA